MKYDAPHFACSVVQRPHFAYLYCKEKSKPCPMFPTAIASDHSIYAVCDSNSLGLGFLRGGTKMCCPHRTAVENPLLHQSAVGRCIPNRLKNANPVPNYRQRLQVFDRDMSCKSRRQRFCTGALVHKSVFFMNFALERP